MNYDGACKFFYIKKTLKKATCLLKEEIKYSLLLFSDVIIQTNKLFLLTTTCIGGQIKAFSFLFCTAKYGKSTKAGKH